MVEVSIGELLLAFVAAMGIPSSIMGIIVWRFKSISKLEKTPKPKRRRRSQDLFLLIVQSTRASIALGEARPTPCSAATRTATWRRRSPTPQTSSTSRRIFSRSKASTPCSMSEGRE